MSEEWKSRAQKPADFCWGTCLGISRGAPEVWARLAYVSFLPHDLVTGGIPHTGFRHKSTGVVAISFSRGSSRPNPGIKTESPVSPALHVGSFLLQPLGKPLNQLHFILKIKQKKVYADTQPSVRWSVYKPVWNHACFRWKQCNEK